MWRTNMVFKTRNMSILMKNPIDLEALEIVSPVMKFQKIENQYHSRSNNVLGRIFYPKILLKEILSRDRKYVLKASSALSKSTRKGFKYATYIMTMVYFLFTLQVMYEYLLDDGAVNFRSSDGSMHTVPAYWVAVFIIAHALITLAVPYLFVIIGWRKTDGWMKNLVVLGKEIEE